MSHSLDFKNKTDRTWTLGMYLTFSGSVDLDSIAWGGVKTVAPGQLLWHGFALAGITVFQATYSQEGGRSFYRVANQLMAGPGGTWEISARGLREISAGHPRPELTIVNSSGHVATAGIGMNNNPAVCKKSLENGASMRINLVPKIYVGLFNELKPGEVISGNVSVGPLLLQYPRQETYAMLTASLQGSETVLSITYSVAPLARDRPL